MLLQARLGVLGWNVLLVFLALRVGDFANLVTKFVLGRFLGGRDFGAVDPALSVVAFFSIPVGVIFQVGMRSISRLHAIGHEDQRRALVQDLLKIAVVGAGVTILAVYALQSYIMGRLHLEGSVYIHLIAGLFLLAWIHPMLNAVLQGEHRYGVLALPSMISGPAMLILTWLLVVVVPFGLPGALLSRIFATALAMAAMFFFLRGSFVGERRPYTEERSSMRAMLLPMAAYAFGGTALVHFDRLLVRNFMPDLSDGYGAIISLGTLPQTFLVILAFVMFPVASGEHARGRDIGRLRRIGAFSGLAVMIGGVVLFLLTGRFLLDKWNPAFGRVADVLWVYSLAMSMQGVIDLLASVEMARNRYGFLWSLVPLTVVYCGSLYWMRGSVSVLSVVWAGVAVRAAILAYLWQYGMWRRRDTERGNNGGPEPAGGEAT